MNHDNTALRELEQRYERLQLVIGDLQAAIGKLQQPAPNPPPPGGNGFTGLAVANGSIPARSGSAAGIGSVYTVSGAPAYDSSNNLTGVTLSTGSVGISVYNPSSTTMSSGNGIDSGQYCWVQNGMVIPLECA
jgi:hypothetical protein